MQLVLRMYVSEVPKFRTFSPTASFTTVAVACDVAASNEANNTDGGVAVTSTDESAVRCAMPSSTVLLVM